MRPHGVPVGNVVGQVGIEFLVGRDEVVVHPKRLLAVRGEEVGICTVERRLIAQWRERDDVDVVGWATGDRLDVLGKATIEPLEPVVQIGIRQACAQVEQAGEDGASRRSATEPLAEGEDVRPVGSALERMSRLTGADWRKDTPSLSKSGIT